MKTLLPLIVLGLLAACQPVPAPSAPLPSGDSNQTSLDWAGRYQGTLPCADCAGIETSLTLSESGRYTLTETYLGKGKPFVTKGRFTWDSTGSTVTLDNDARRFKVGEGRIWHLDQQGQIVTGSLADHYILTKAD